MFVWEWCMKAIGRRARDGPEALAYDEAQQPRPGEGEVLVRVHAAGVIHTELSWLPTWTNRAGGPPAAPRSARTEATSKRQRSRASAWYSPRSAVTRWTGPWAYSSPAEGWRPYRLQASGRAASGFVQCTAAKGLPLPLCSGSKD